MRLPIACGPLSNGEGWWPDNPRKKLIRKLVLEKADEVARRERIDRREFLASSCGMATTLYMINLVNGCSSGKKMTGGSPSSNAGRGGSSSGMGDSDGGMAGSGSAGRGMPGAGSGSMAGSGSGTAGMSGDGGFMMPPEAMCDSEMADQLLGMDDDTLIIDMQTHFSNTDTNMFGGTILTSFIGQINQTRFPWLQRGSVCMDAYMANGMWTPECIDQREYIDQIMLGSDTTIGVLSGISYALGDDGTGGNFAVLTNEDLIDGAMKLEAMFPGRILTHAMVMPNDRLEIQLAMMERTAGTYTNWKTYPPWSRQSNSGYWLDGLDDPDMVGPRMIQKGLELGSAVFCIHKGFPLSSFSALYTDPRDVGPAANMFPEAYFVIYHSAFEHGLSPGGTSTPSDAAPMGMSACDLATMVQRSMYPSGAVPEGPFDEANPDAMGNTLGVNSLVKSLRDNNIGPNGTRLDPMTKEIIPGTEGSTRVYAETGGVWPNLMTGRVEEAMHFWGKLLKYVGEDRIVWGTDCLWFGNPQPLIEAFRCFQISEEFQETYGYPALTACRKAKILGLNARTIQNSRLPADKQITATKHSEVASAWQMRLKRDLDGEFGRRRDMIANVWGPRTRREFLSLSRQEHHEKMFWSGRVPSRGWNGKV